MQNRIEELRSLLRAEPGSRRFFQLGDLLRKIGDYAEAERILRAGLEHHPRYTAAWISLGRVHLEQEHFGEAERAFARSLELDAENSVAARLLGDTAFAAGEYIRAIKSYKLARALGDPELDAKIDEVQTLINAEVTLPGVLPETFGVETKESPVDEPLLSSPAPLSRPRDVVFVADEDPFGFDDAELPSGEQGDVFAFAGDAGVEAVAAGRDDVFGGAETEERGVDEDRDAIAESGEPEFSLISGEAVAESREISEDSVVAPEAPGEEGARLDEEMPLPTLTLAQLAWNQGDAAMAESTLRLLLLKDPENVEALSLLEKIRASASASRDLSDSPAIEVLREESGDAVPPAAMTAEETSESTLPVELSSTARAEGGIEEVLGASPAGSPKEFLGRKIAALNAWAEGIRRASERMS